MPTKKQLQRSLFIRQEEWRVVFVDRIEGTDTLGMCDPSNRVIFIKNKQSKEETFKSYLHEVIHALEMEHDIKIPHASVYKLEQALFEFLTENF